jgi:hypothetical protein
VKGFPRTVARPSVSHSDAIVLVVLPVTNTIGTVGCDTREGFRELKAVHAGHIDVRQHQPERPINLAGCLQGRRAVLCFQDSPPSVRKDASHELTDRLFIVCQKNYW